jgi:hypothetical protein
MWFHLYPTPSCLGLKGLVVVVGQRPFLLHIKIGEFIEFKMNNCVLSSKVYIIRLEQEGLAIPCALLFEGIKMYLLLNSIVEH